MASRMKYDKQYFKRLQSQIDKAKESALRQAANEGIYAAKERITTTKRDPDNNPWAPWAPATRKIRRKTGGSLLYVTGKLSQSFYSIVDSSRAIIRSSVSYFQYLQNGTFKMPARPMLGWSEKTINKVITSVKDVFR